MIDRLMAWLRSKFWASPVYCTNLPAHVDPVPAALLDPNGEPICGTCAEALARWILRPKLAPSIRAAR